MKVENVVVTALFVFISGCSPSPKTADDCLNDHIKMIDAINTFGSEESRQRQMEQEMKDWRACGDKALENSMK